MEISMDLFFCVKSDKVHNVLTSPGSASLRLVFDFCSSLVRTLSALHSDLVRT